MAQLRLFRSREARRTTLLYTAAGIAALLVTTVLLREHLAVLYDPVALQQAIQGFGIWGPLTVIGLQAAQVIIAPIPGPLVMLSAGFAYGLFWGSLYGFIGLTIGSWTALLLTRRYGRPFVERVVDEDLLARFDTATNNYGLLLLTALFVLPGFPDDAIVYIAGLTNIRLRYLLAVTSLGRLPGMFAMVLAGNRLAIQEFDQMLIVLVVFTTLSGLSVYLRDYLPGLGEPDDV
ncbi:MAG: TVP38/TMEM64 family protein [Candidatus Nanohaloarchaea archaeon]